MSNSDYPKLNIFRKNDQVVYLVGVQHTNDKNDPQLKKLESSWTNFLFEKNSFEAVVLIEGGDWPIEKNSIDAISNYGEMAYIKYLAVEASIVTFSPEPDEMLEITELLKSFSKDEIMYYYFARLVLQWQRSNKQVELDEYIDMMQYKNLTNWTDYDFSMNHFVEIHNNFNDHLFHKEKCEECLLFDTRFIKVEATSRKIRDQYICKEVGKYIKIGKSLFIVFGSSHTEWLAKKLALYF